MRDFAEALSGVVDAPEHIKACAAAVRYDLLYGPAWAAIPPAGIEAFTVDMFATYFDDLEQLKEEGHTVEEVYTGRVGDALREYIENLPGELYYDADAGDVMASEPEGEEIDGEWYEPAPYYALSARDVVEALFGKTIATEFN